jgi:hypothetical protein
MIFIFMELLLLYLKFFYAFFVTSILIDFSFAFGEGAEAYQTPNSPNSKLPIPAPDDGHRTPPPHGGPPPTRADPPPVMAPLSLAFS